MVVDEAGVGINIADDVADDDVADDDDVVDDDRAF